MTKSIESRSTPHPPYVERFITDRLLGAMKESRAVALLGARQTGKSTLVRRLADRTLGARYLTLDDAAALALAIEDPAGFLSGLETPLVIDEIQRAPDLLLAIKARVDRDDSRGQFLLTGSANLRRLPTVPDALPGRVDYLTLWPFSQGELVGQRENFLESLFSGKPPRTSNPPVGRGAYAELLLRGGYPEAQHRSATGRTTFFESYVQSITERDVPDTSRIHDASTIGELLRLIGVRSGSIARYEKLGREIGIDGKTAKAHAQILERLYLIRIRQPWHRNLGKRQIKAPKLYVADPGLLGSLVGVNEARIESDGGVAGAIFETFVATELERQASWSVEPCSFWHLRDDGREVDVIAERRSGEIVGIEVKSAATVRPGDFAGLKWLRDRSGEAFRGGAVLYTGDQVLPFGDRLWAVPLQSVWQR